MGKVIAQHAFSDAAAASGRWDAITVCPSDNVGPILSPHHKDGGPWQHLIERMVEGHCEIFQGTGPYRPWMTVDVRDDAACHVGLLESDKVANGERYLAMSTETRSYEDICTSIDRVLARAAPRPGTRSSTRRRIGGRSGRTSSARSGAGLQLRNDRIRAAVPITFRPLDDSIRDCVESLLAVAHVIPNRRSD